MRFKGCHKDKRRITYKTEGDGFRADALCEDGYTYQVYLRNERAPMKYLKQGLSPLHPQTMALFDSLSDNYRRVPNPGGSKFIDSGQIVRPSTGFTSGIATRCVICCN